MTAICGGGPSSPLPLTEPVINMTAAGAEALATLWGFPELGIPLSLAAGALDIVAAVVCGTDPPADPVLTSTDVINALDVFNPGLAIPAQLRIQQWFLSRYWYAICQCNAVTTPLPPAMSNPSTPVGINTGAPSGVNAAPCWSITAESAISNHTLFGYTAVDPWLPAGPGSKIVDPGNASLFVCIPPPNMTAISWAFENLSSGVPIDLILESCTPGGAHGSIQTIAHSGTAGVQSGSRLYTPTVGAPYIDLLFVSNPLNNAPWTTVWNGTLTITCSDAPPNALVQPCCPPDPLIDGKLDMILGLVLDLYNRGGVGTSGYKLGTVHAGVTGTGSFAANDLAGVLVHITAQPPTQTQPGNPTYIMDMGWLSCSTPDGFIDEKRLTRTNQIWLPQLFPISTSFGYFLFPGVTATITELQRA